MILVVCARDIDSTLVRGDLISWKDGPDITGKQVGVVNAVTLGSATDVDSYIAGTPYIVLNLPQVTMDDVEEIRRDCHEVWEDGVRQADGPRRWKIDFSALENRGNNTFYGEADDTPTKRRFGAIVSGAVRRDTLNAYNEITRANITMADIKVLR